MRLVLTLVVRDEVDIVGEQIRYHLNAGVDFVIATDHDSRDGTTEVLENFEREGHLRLVRETGEMRDSAWRTSMARIAATEHGADWVLNTDADEFWMPRRGTLKDTLSAVPDRFGIVWAITRHFVPRPEDGRSFAERMTVRFAATAPLNDPTSAYRPHAKAAHRADPGIVVLYGSHDVRSALSPLRGWYPADVLHFPFRTREQWERKGVRRADVDKALGQYVRASTAAARGRSEDVYGDLVVDDAIVARGLSEGSLVEDVRLRDALGGGSRSVGDDTVEQIRAVADSAALDEANAVRLRRQLDLLQDRLSHIEARARRRVRRSPATENRLSA